MFVSPSMSLLLICAIVLLLACRERHPKGGARGAREKIRRLLHLYTYGGLRVSCLHDLASMAVYNNLAGRNV